MKKTTLIGSLALSLLAAPSFAGNFDNFGGADASNTQPGPVVSQSTIAHYEPSTGTGSDFSTMAPAAGAPLAPVPAPAYSNVTTTSAYGAAPASPPSFQAPEQPTATPIWQAAPASGMPQAMPAQASPTAANDSLFITGGVTKDERDSLAAISRNYNLKLQFSNNSGELVSDVEVTISSAKGEQILSTTTDGPVLMAKLSPGKYRVESSKDGVTKTQTVDVGKGMKSLNVIWKEA